MSGTNPREEASIRLQCGCTRRQASWDATGTNFWTGWQGQRSQPRLGTPLAGAGDVRAPPMPHPTTARDQTFLILPRRGGGGPSLELGGGTLR